MGRRSPLMRRWLGPAIVALLAAQAAPASAQAPKASDGKTSEKTWQLCHGPDTAADVRISSCSALIESRLVNGRSLA